MSRPDFEMDKGRVEHILQTLLQLCQRTSSRVDDKMREHMWLSTLGLVVSLPRKYHDTQNKQLEEGKREGGQKGERKSKKEREGEKERRRREEREGGEKEEKRLNALHIIPQP